MRNLIIVLVLTSSVLQAQVTTHVLNRTARSAALAGSELVKANGANALFANPASLVDSEQRSFLAGYQKIFSQSWMPYTVMGVTSPIGQFGHAGISLESSGVTYMDTTLSNELNIGLSHGFYLMKDRLSGLALAYTVRYYSVDYGRSAGVSGDGSDGLDLGSGSAVGFDLALRANLSDRYWGAVVIRNINQPALGEGDARVDLPQEVQAGFAYKPLRDVWTNFSLVSTLEHDTQVHAGLDYAISEIVSVLMGIQSNPNRVGLGFEINYRQVHLEYGLLTHPVLPMTQVFTLQVGL